MKEFSYSLDNIEQAVEWFLQQINGEQIWLMQGDLGAGKTTFIKAVGRYLAFEEAVSSPTFSLINHYSFVDKFGEHKKVYHADLYRIKDEEEAINAGVEDIFADKDALKIIEWPEQAAGIIPQENIAKIRLEIVQPQERIIYLNLQ